MPSPNKRRLAATLLKSAAILLLEGTTDSDEQAIALVRSATHTVSGLVQQEQTAPKPTVK